MIIYQILNLVNGKSYIGQTVNNLKSRYRNYWWKNTTSRYLLEDVSIYGVENFALKVLEDGIESKETLNQREKSFIRLFDSVYPNGYNANAGGGSLFVLNNDTKRRMAAAKRGKEFIYLKNQITGSIEQIFSIEEFAQENSLLASKLSEVSTGVRKTHRFWTLPETELKFWIFQNKDGRKVKIIDGQRISFAKEEGMTSYEAEKLVSGFDVKGWSTILFQPEKGWNKKKTKFIPSHIRGPKYEEIYQNGTSLSSDCVGTAFLGVGVDLSPS